MPEEIFYMPTPLTEEERALRRTEFVRAIAHTINCHSMENESDTPDWLLAEYLAHCFDAWNTVVRARDKWYNFRQPFYVEPPVTE